MFKKISHYFIPHRETHQKAKLLSWHFMAVYLILFLLLQGAVNIISINKPGVLGINSNLSTEQIIEETNKERQKAGLTLLTENSTLDAAAKLKAQNMFAENYWAHFSPSGKDPWGFINSAGYRFSFAGENLARNYYNSEDVVKAWMASPTHKENLLNPKYQDIGIAVVDGVLKGQKTTLVVQMFGRPYEPLAVKPEVNMGGQKIAVETQKVSPQEMFVAGVEQSSVPNAIFDPSVIGKSVGIGIFALLAFLIVADFVVLKLRGVNRTSSHHLSHLGFLAVAGASLFLIKAGEIL